MVRIESTVYKLHAVEYRHQLQTHICDLIVAKSGIQIVSNIILNDDQVGPDRMYSVCRICKTIIQNSLFFFKQSSNLVYLLRIINEKESRQYYTDQMHGPSVSCYFNHVNAEKLVILTPQLGRCGFKNGADRMHGLHTTVSLSAILVMHVWYSL